MKALFYLPTLFVNHWRSNLLPRWLFLATYAPQGEGIRKAEEQCRNIGRRVAYHAKRALTPDHG